MKTVSAAITAAADYKKRGAFTHSVGGATLAASAAASDAATLAAAIPRTA